MFTFEDIDPLMLALGIMGMILLVCIVIISDKFIKRRMYIEIGEKPDLAIIRHTEGIYNHLGDALYRSRQSLAVEPV